MSSLRLSYETTFLTGSWDYKVYKCFGAVLDKLSKSVAEDGLLSNVFFLSTVPKPHHLCPLQLFNPIVYKGEWNMFFLGEVSPLLNLPHVDNSIVKDKHHVAVEASVRVQQQCCFSLQVLIGNYPDIATSYLYGQSFDRKEPIICTMMSVGLPKFAHLVAMNEVLCKNLYLESDLDIISEENDIAKVTIERLKKELSQALAAQTQTHLEKEMLLETVEQLKTDMVQMQTGNERLQRFNTFEIVGSEPVAEVEMVQPVSVSTLVVWRSTGPLLFLATLTFRQWQSWACQNKRAKVLLNMLVNMSRQTARSNAFLRWCSLVTEDKRRAVLHEKRAVMLSRMLVEVPLQTACKKSFRLWKADIEAQKQAVVLRRTLLAAALQAADIAAARLEARAKRELEEKEALAKRELLKKCKKGQEKSRRKAEQEAAKREAAEKEAAEVRHAAGIEARKRQKEKEKMQERENQERLSEIKQVAAAKRAHEKRVAASPKQTQELESKIEDADPAVVAQLDVWEIDYLDPYIANYVEYVAQNPGAPFTTADITYESHNIKFLTIMQGLDPNCAGFKMWRKAYWQQQFKAICKQQKNVPHCMALEMQKLPATDHSKYFLIERIYECLKKEDFDIVYTLPFVSIYIGMIKNNFQTLSTFFGFISRSSHLNLLTAFWDERDSVLMSLFELCDLTISAFTFIFEKSQTSVLPEFIIERIQCIRVEESPLYDLQMKLFMRYPRPSFVVYLMEALIDTKNVFSTNFIERLLKVIFLQLLAAKKVADSTMALVVAKAIGLLQERLQGYNKNCTELLAKIMSLL